MVLAQQEVKAGSNELTATKPLLEPLDLRGKVVTADAMHAQVDLARHLVEEKTLYVKGVVNLDYRIHASGPP